jgi:hypothetical protein
MTIARELFGHKNIILTEKQNGKILQEIWNG